PAPGSPCRARRRRSTRPPPACRSTSSRPATSSSTPTTARRRGSTTWRSTPVVGCACTRRRRARTSSWSRCTGRASCPTAGGSELLGLTRPVRVGVLVVAGVLGALEGAADLLLRLLPAHPVRALDGLAGLEVLVD